MDRRAFVVTVAGFLATPLAAEAQEAGKIVRIGFLRFGTPPPAFIEGFRQGLRDLGYVEGKTVVIKYGLAQSPDKLPEVAAELTRLRVDVIVASGVPSVLPAKNATRTIPVVFVSAIDPVSAGVVASLARPGGHVTGLTAIQADLTAKRFELLREIVPRLSRVAILVRATSPETPNIVKESELAARAIGAALQVLTLREPHELDVTLSKAHDSSALFQSDDAVFTAHRAQIAEFALKKRLPLVSGLREVTEAGGFISYGAHLGDLHRRAALYVDKILKGAKPADLPVEQPTKFELVINLKTAKALGLTIPPALRERADELIQ